MELGTHLIARRRITEDDLVEALLWQREQRIPLPRLALERGVCTAAQLLELLGLEHKSPDSFRELLKRLPDVEGSAVEALVQEHNDSGPPLGQVLLAMGMLSDQELEEELQLFGEAKRNP